MSEQNARFWQEKSLDHMSQKEWESLCDGCGLCCLHKLEDYDTSTVSYTNVACRLLDTETCRCRKYSNRKKLVPDCVILKPQDVKNFKWLPKTCAYRLISEGKELPYYHHLVSGSSSTIDDEGMSVKNAVVSETDVSEDEQIKRIVIWPGEPSAYKLSFDIINVYFLINY